jgi:hypothetical protein
MSSYVALFVLVGACSLLVSVLGWKHLQPQVNFIWHSFVFPLRATASGQKARLKMVGEHFHCTHIPLSSPFGSSTMVKLGSTITREINSSAVDNPCSACVLHIFAFSVLPHLNGASYGWILVEELVLRSYPISASL